MVDISVEDLLEAFSAEGRVFVGDLLTADEIRTLLIKSDEILQENLGPSGASSAFFDCLGYAPEFDDVIESLMSNPIVVEFLRNVLGPGYRLCSTVLRRASPGSPANQIHQDSPGETRLVVLLTDTRTMDGSTFFVPGSHRWPRILNGFPYAPRWFIDRFCVGNFGSVGQVFAFSGRLWHGRRLCEHGPNTAILVNFLPQGYPPYYVRSPPDEVVPSLGPSIRSRIGPADQRLASIGPSTEALNDLITYRTALAWYSPWKIVIPVGHLLVGAVKYLRERRGRAPKTAEQRAFEARLKKANHFTESYKR